MTLKFDGWREFKLKLQSGKTQFGSKSAFFVSCDLEIWWMALKNNRASLLYSVKLCTSFQSNPETLKSGLNRRFFVSCDLEILWMTLKTNRAPLLYNIKLYASFLSHRWIQTGFRVRKRSIRVKIGDFLSRVTLKFNGWPWKIIGYLSYAISTFMHHFVAIGEFKLELQSGNAQLGSK